MIKSKLLNACRVIPLDILQKGESTQNSAMNCDKEKYRQMRLDAAETVLAYFALIGLFMEHDERTKYTEAEIMMDKQ